MRDDRIREEIRSRVDIVEVIGDYVALKRAGSTFKGLCPFHDEKTPSFNVIPRIQRYHCFGCQASGDVFKFLMEMDKLTFPEAMKRLADRAGVRYEPRASSPQEVSERERQHEVHRVAAQMFHEALLKSAGATAARSYLQQRGLSAAMIARFQLGFAPESWDATTNALRRRGFTLDEIVLSGLAIARENSVGAYDRFRHRLIFPIHDAQGNVIAFGGRTLGQDDAKYLNTPDTRLFTKGQTLYGLHLATPRMRDRDAVIVCEGYMDLIALHEQGFDHAVATMGTALTPGNLQRLRRFTKNVFACFDGDSAGMNAVLRSAPLFEQQEVSLRVIALPPDDDPDTFLRQRGPAAFAELLERAQPLIDYRIARVVAGFDVRDDASRVALVSAVLPILREIRDNTTLDAQIVKVARRWSGGDLKRAQSIEAAIKAELRRGRRGSRVEANRPASPDEARAAKGAVPGYVRGERQLLTALLNSLERARGLFASLSAEDFLDEANREIARSLQSLAARTRGDSLSSSDARAFVEEVSPAAAAVVSELFSNEPTLDDRGLATIVREMKERKARMEQSAQLRQQAARIDEDRSTAGAPEPPPRVNR